MQFDFRHLKQTIKNIPTDNKGLYSNGVLGNQELIFFLIVLMYFVVIFFI